MLARELQVGDVVRGVRWTGQKMIPLRQAVRRVTFAEGYAYVSFEDGSGGTFREDDEINAERPPAP